MLCMHLLVVLGVNTKQVCEVTWTSLRLMRQDNQPLHGAFGEFVPVLWCLRRWLLLHHFPFWHQLAWLKPQHRSESGCCRRQAEDVCIRYCLFRFQLFDGCVPFVVYGYFWAVWHNDESVCFEIACTSLTLCILFCSYQASAKCLIADAELQKCSECSDPWLFWASIRK